MVEPRGIAPRSTQCHCVVLLLDDGPEMERAPGLAPGKSGFASRRLDDFGIARFWKWGGRRVLPPLGDLHRIECWLLHHGLRLKLILRPALPRHGLLYEMSALLISATEECVARKRPTRIAERSPHSRRSGKLKWCSREDLHLDLPPSQSGVHLLHFGRLKNGAPCRCCPGARGLEDRRASVTPMTL